MILDRMRTGMLLVFAVALVAASCSILNAGRIWWDGSADNENVAPGKLLSDNPNYWGECVLTGVDYRYEALPDSPAEVGGSSSRSLLNGKTGDGVGMSGNSPLVVVFDFKRICVFSEWNICSPSKKAAIKIETRETEHAPWVSVFDRGLEDCPESEFHRVVLAEKPRGRFVRLTMVAADNTRLSEVVAWGDDASGSTVPEPINPIAQGQYPVGIAYPTVTGVSASSISDREAFYWVDSLKPRHKKQTAVWARVPTWSGISNTPVTPKPDSINQPVKIVMARNETECVALALKNTLVDSPRDVEVKFSGFTNAAGAAIPGLGGKIGVMGVIGDRGFGNNLGPIFEADNLLGDSLMKRYLLNGEEISDFPRLKLAPSGAAVIWLSVTSDGAKPGVYKAWLQAADNERVPVDVEVLDVTLPMTFAHVKTYCDNRTGMWPFEYSDRTERDYSYALDSGLSDWVYSETIKKMAAERKMRLLYNMGWLVHWYTLRSMKENDSTEAIAQNVADQVREVVRRAESAGLNYDDWYQGTADEPNAGDIEGYGTMCRLIKEADPNVNVYVNPAYWTGFDHGGVADDATVVSGLRGKTVLKDWYRKYVDISMPLMLLLRNRPEAFKEFSYPRLVNSYYYVSGHLDRSEQALEIQKYRRMAWDSFSMGFNGWAFYSWYSPRGNPWNHFDQDGREPSDYQMVYPGPRGVVPTRHSEALREGWEDWRLLNLLKEKGMNSTLKQVLEGYKQGRPLDELRTIALRAAAQSNRGDRDTRRSR